MPDTWKPPARCRVPGCAQPRLRLEDLGQAFSPLCRYHVRQVPDPARKAIARAESELARCWCEALGAIGEEREREEVRMDVEVGSLFAGECEP